MSKNEAIAVAEGWLQTGTNPLGITLGDRTQPAITLLSDTGQALFYCIPVKPTGGILIAADNRIEPIMAFYTGSIRDFSESNPLIALAQQDLEARMNALLPVRSTQTAIPDNAEQTATEQKWKDLLAIGRGEVRFLQGMTSVDDERVAPLIQSRWNQKNYWDGSQYQSCYNYYTPPYANGSTSNYYCGCVATVYGQLMRYFSFPTTGVGTGQYQITVDGTNEFRNLRGGNDIGGAYAWSNMPLIPGATTTLAQRQAIGRLCHDVTLVDEASFTATGTSAYLSPADFKSVFNFSQAFEGWWDNWSFWNMVNASLDAGLPLSMSVKRAGGSHLVICDGYGYNLSTPYHHLNMGWGGTDNAWYNLPDIDAVNHQYTGVTRVVYNIYTNGTGEIISGRIVDESGSAITGAQIRVEGGGQTNIAWSGAHGIYAVDHLPSDTSFNLTASNATRRFADRSINTGTSVEDGDCGNRWGILFQAQETNGMIIAGTVLQAGTIPVNGILVSAGAENSATTDVSGYYIFTVQEGWTGTVTYALEGYDFSPANRSYTNLTSNAVNEDVEASSYLYVDVDATGSDNGSSWADAFTNLVDALDEADSGTAILVAEGTYYPGSSRSDYFRAQDDVNLYGGFAGTETNASQRNPQAHVTVLSADIGTVGVATDNCYHVIYGWSKKNSCFDGFTITDGYADSATSSRDRGGGLYLYGSTNVSVVDSVITSNYAAYGAGLYYGTASNCVITENNASDYGGGTYKARAVNCLIYSNTANYGGGSMWSTNINATITKNTAVTNGGGIYSGVTENSIVWGNNASSGSNQAFSTVSYSCVAPLASGAGNIAANPLFIDPAQNDYRLLPTSPCTNAGNDAYASGTTDLAGNARIWNETVDMGAYETIYFDVSANAATNGTVAPTGTIQVYIHENSTFTNQPAPWYHVSEITVNGIPSETNLIFVSTNVQENQSIEIAFSENIVTGLPANVTESWLAQYGWTNQFYHAASADQDTDNMLTWQEYVAGTIPTSSASFFHLQGTWFNASTGIVLHWSPVATGRTYFVSTTTNLMNTFSNVAELNYPVNTYTVQVENTLHNRIEVSW